VATHIDWEVAAAERGGYEHFLIKEIMEQPDVIRNSLAGRINAHDEVRLENLFSDHVWNEIDRVNIIGCGTAFHAGLMGKHLFEKLLRLPTDVYYSSEFRYGDPVLSPKSLAIFVSQSGETADTLAALRLCKSRRIRTLGIVNVVGSSIARECDRTLITQAGPEISVASTKAYTAQIISLTLLALHIVRIQETPGIAIREWSETLKRLPDIAREVLQKEPEVEVLAKKMEQTPLCFFLGRGADAYIGYEAALKLKEIAYVPTQESPAGEMKHGPLALVTPGVVAVFSCTDSETVDKIVSNMKEVQARGGLVVCVTTDRTGIIRRAADEVIEIPATKHEFLNALLAVIPLQMLAYHIAKLRGCEIDQPRNLAKSVTVE
jgi:glucosamine--fructose-6-phosphate aminotransferase (isomerizing)